jgi:hypothetical protein
VINKKNIASAPHHSLVSTTDNGNAYGNPATRRNRNATKAHGRAIRSGSLSGLPTLAEAFEFDDARSNEVARVVSGVSSMRLPNPRQLLGMKELHQTLLVGQRLKGGRQIGMALFDPTGVGKTTIAEALAQGVNAKAPKGEKPIVHCRLANSGTARSLFVSALSEIGYGYANQKSEQRLQRELIDALEEHNTKLLIIDESQHGGRNSGFGGPVTAAIKLLLDTGVVPIALLGTEKAVEVFANDVELSGRLSAPCSLAPFSWWDTEDCELWMGLMSALDRQLVADGIVTKPFGFDDAKVAEKLIAATNGTMGQLMGMVRTAVQEMARDGRSSLTEADVVHAIDAWCVAHGFAARNPFRTA